MLNREQTLFDQFEYKGDWCLPETTDNAVPGILTFDESDITLELFGDLRHVSTAELGVVRPARETLFILGRFHGGKPCTLYKSVETGRSFQPFQESTNTTTYRSTYLFIGKHITSEDELRFSELFVNYTHLEEWFGVSPFGVDESKREGGNLVRVDSVYVQPPKFSVQVPSLDAAIGSDYGLMRSGNMFRSHTLEHVAFITIKPRQPQPLDWYLRVMSDCQNLLTLFVGNVIFPKRVLFWGEEKEIPAMKVGDQEVPATKHTEDIEAYFHQSYKKVTKAPHPYEMLASWPVLQDRLNDIIVAWFSKEEKLRNVYNLFFGALYNTRQYLQFHFLSLVQALEVYSRAVHGGNYVSDDEYAKVAAALVAAIPPTDPDLRQSLKDGKIKYGNQYSLRKRLRQILCSLEDDTVGLFCKKPTQFCEKVTKTRNYYTHYTSELREASFQGRELYFVCQRLRVLMLILLFKELGLEENLIRQIVSRNPDLMQLRHLHFNDSI